MVPVNNRTKLILYLSDFSHIGGALTLCPLQLRLQVLLFSSQLQGRGKDERNTHKTECLKSEQLNIDNMRRVKQKADIFQFRSLSKSFDVLLQRCNSLAHLMKETQECTVKVYEMQGFEHISGLVFSLELIARWKPEHTPLQLLLVTAPASSSSETPPAPHYSGGAAGFPPVNATGIIV